MTRVRHFLLLGVLVYIYVVVRQFPADVAIDLFAPESVTVYGIGGTVWKGSADAIAPPGSVALGATSWEISPLWILTGRLKGDLSTQLSDTSRLNTGFSKPFFGDGLSLNDAQGILDLSVLPANLRPNGIVGRIGLSFDSLALDAMWPTRAKGSVDLVQLSVTRPRRVDVGSFEVLFDGDSRDPLVGNVTDTSSEVAVNGTLSLAPDRTYELKINAKPRPGANRNVVETLPLMGEPRPDGSVDLVYNEPLF